MSDLELVYCGTTTEKLLKTTDLELVYRGTTTEKLLKMTDLVLVYCKTTTEKLLKMTKLVSCRTNHTQAMKKDQLSIPNTHLSKQSAFNMGVGNTMLATGLLLAIFNVTVSRLKIVTDTDWARSRQTTVEQTNKKDKKKNKKEWKTN